MSSDIPRRIKNMAKSQELEVSVRIGRAGISESLVSEMSDQLSRNHLVKVKANKGTTSDRKQRVSLFYEVAELTNSNIVFQRGNVAVFWSGK
ncbi:MAG: YhbY family RNA-binding protein [Candidatus Thalassarchaeaceae archaeon]|jgi:RNA-binding protein YhbY|nr:YhbY family RNA-binding protein [Candidatus Thalassarchaeaceae archaeon]